MTRGLQTAEIADAIAYISEQIDSLRKEHSDLKNEVTQELRQWSNINLEMIRVLQDQSQWQPKLMKQQLQQTQHLLRCAETSERLGISTQSLTTSTSGLLSSTEDLKIRSAKLSDYLQSDQAQRLELLQNGLKALLEKMNYQSPRTISLPGKKNSEIQDLMIAVERLTQISSDPKVVQNSRDNRWLKIGVHFTLVICLSMVIGSWFMAKEVAQSNRRASWALTKLERIENVLGVK